MLPTVFDLGEALRAVHAARKPTDAEVTSYRKAATEALTGEGVPRPQAAQLAGELAGALSDFAGSLAGARAAAERVDNVAEDMMNAILSGGKK